MYVLRTSRCWLAKALIISRERLVNCWPWDHASGCAPYTVNTVDMMKWVIIWIGPLIIKLALNHPQDYQIARNYNVRNCYAPTPTHPCPVALHLLGTLEIGEI